MPNIKQYDSPALDIRPTEVGVEATAAVGRRAGQFFNQMGQSIGGGVKDLGDAYVEYQDHQQMSRGAKDFSALIAEKDQLWNDTLKNSDPNDPTVAARFREEQLEPALEKFKEGFTTQKSQQFAEHLTEQFRTHMVHQTMADMSTQAGIAVRTNAKQTANNLASAVNLNPTPAFLETSLKMLDTSLDAITASNANLTPAEAAKIKTEFGQEAKKGIVKSAIAGMVQKNPNVDLDAIQKKYGDYIDGAEMRQFQKAAQQYQQAGVLTQKRIEALDRERGVVAAHGAASKLMTELVSKDPITNRTVIDPDYFNRVLKIAGMKNAPDGLARTLWDWGVRQEDKEDKAFTDQNTRADLLSRIGAPQNPTTEIDIRQARASGKLTAPDETSLINYQKAVHDRPEGEPIRRSRDDFFKRYAPTIYSPMDSAGNQSMLGAQKMYEAQMDARHAEDALRAQGKDPALVYDPRSPEFFGNPKNLARYHVSMQADADYRKNFEANAKKAGAFTPPSTWLFSATRQQYRDPATGKLYDKTGKEIVNDTVRGPR